MNGKEVARRLHRRQLCRTGYLCRPDEREEHHMRHDHRTRERRKADASAHIAAVCLFLAVLFINF